jgi:hypothetical protein
VTNYFDELTARTIKAYNLPIELLILDKSRRYQLA